MRKWLIYSGLAALLVLSTGCGSDAPPEVSKPQTSRLGDSIDISLSELLTKPRSELAEMADEWTQKIHIQEKGRRVGTLYLSLLAEFRLPLVAPVWREVKYSAKAGFSLPPYLAEDSRDSALALHVARYGDLEAARKLVEPGDGETLKKIDEFALEKPYPLEWTRLAGLLLHAAQLRLATGDVDGGTEVVVLHRQLKELLGPKAVKSPLGAALLGRGLETMQRTQKVWQEDKKTELADQAKIVLAEWGEVAPPPLALYRGQERTELQRALHNAGQGRCWTAPNLQRALDVLELPFSDEGLEAVIACLDEAGRLNELFLTYRAGLSEHFPDAASFAHLLEECQVPGNENSKQPGVTGKTYRIAGWDCDVSLISHGAGIGAFVHFSAGKEPPPWKPLARNVAGVDLDHSFDQARLRLAPEQRKDSLVVSKPATLAQVANLLPSLKPAQLVIDRVKDHDLVAQLAIDYKIVDQGCPPLHVVALPLWSSFGTPHMQGATDEHGGHLALAWEDAMTRYVLCLPYEASQAVRLEIGDRQPAETVARREAAALAREDAERSARVQAGNSLLLIPRQLEQFELGMTRSQVSELLPTGQACLKLELPTMMVATFTGEASRDDKYVVRQLFVHFDKQGRAAEIRARYADGPGAGSRGNWTGELLKGLKKRAGAPAEFASSWANLWNDVSGKKSAARLYTWRDDVSQLTYQFDAAGAEVCLTGRPIDPESDGPMAAFEYLPRGVAGCLLGTKRDALYQGLGIKNPDTMANGAVVLRPEAQSPYDVLLVWFDNERVVRIVGRYAPVAGETGGSIPPARAVNDAWGRDARALGWPRRQDFGGNEVLQSLGWHDDRTRVRIFWQENDDGSTRVFSEWKDLRKQ